MKEFEFLELEDFLQIADQLETPFKFFEIEDLTDITVVDAKVWLRTAYLSFHYETKETSEIEKITTMLLEHGFKHVVIKETAVPVK